MLSEAFFGCLLVFGQQLTSSYVQANSNVDCSPYKLNVKTLDNCVEDSLISVSSSRFILKDDCTLHGDACLSYRPFEKAVVSYELKVQNMADKGGDGRLLAGKFDACQIANKLKPEETAILQLLNFQVACPIMTSNELCSRPVNLAFVPELAKVLETASLLGDVDLKLDVEHEGGRRSCVHMVANLSGHGGVPMMDVEELQTVARLISARLRANKRD